MRSDFFTKIHVKVFYIQILCNCEAQLFFQTETMIYRKKEFIKKH